MKPRDVDNAAASVMTAAAQLPRRAWNITDLYGKALTRVTASVGASFRAVWQRFL